MTSKSSCDVHTCPHGRGCLVTVDGYHMCMPIQETLCQDLKEQYGMFDWCPKKPKEACDCDCTDFRAEIHYDTTEQHVHPATDTATAGTNAGTNAGTTMGTATTGTTAGATAGAAAGATMGTTADTELINKIFSPSVIKKMNETVLSYFKPTGPKTCIFSRDKPFWKTVDLYNALLKVNAKVSTTNIVPPVWLGENYNSKLTSWNENNREIYAKVNLASFLGQQRLETGVYNACDENNWSNMKDPGYFSSGAQNFYNAAAACGQGGQQYNNLTCGEDTCLVNGAEATTAKTSAKWSGAPPPLSCKLKGADANIGVWDSAGNGKWITSDDDATYTNLQENKKYMTCPCFKSDDNTGNKTSCTGYERCATDTVNGCSCPNGYEKCYTDKNTLVTGCEPPKTTEGCCWWGRGAIQLSGPCNIGKFNKVYGSEDNNFCKNPELICNTGETGWAAGLVYWTQNVQNEKLKYDENKTFNQRQSIVDCVNNAMTNSNSGSPTAEEITTACANVFNTNSAIVNRGCLPDSPKASADCEGHASTLHAKGRRESSELALGVLLGESPLTPDCSATMKQYTTG